MTSKKLLKQLSEFLDMDKRKRTKLADELKSIIKELKNKEKKLISKCKNLPKENKRNMLEREVAVLHLKRKKGLKALKKLINK